MDGGVVLVGFVHGVAVGVVVAVVVFRKHKVALVVLEHLDASVNGLFAAGTKGR
jgi:MFS superfamily sulfate permease-like transporter